MRTWLSERALPIALVLVALVVANASGVALVFSRGFSFSFSALGLALQVPLVLGLALACRGVLARTRRLSPVQTGVVADARSVGELIAGSAIGALAVGAIFVVLAATGCADLGRASSSTLGATGVVVGLLASWTNAALQQLGVGSLALAASRDGRGSAAAAALSVLLFVGTHLPEASGSIYVTNVALFGALSLALFFFGTTPRYGAVVGMHGAWNFALVLGGGIPEARDLAVLTYHPRDALGSGGDAGPESGVVYAAVLAIVLAAVMAARARRRG